MFQTLQGLISGLQLLVSLAGLGVSVSFLGRSRWAGLLAAAFTVEAFVGLGYRVLLYLVMHGTVTSEAREPAFALLGLLGLAAWVAIVVGIGFVLRALPAPERRPIVEPVA